MTDTELADHLDRLADEEEGDDIQLVLGLNVVRRLTDALRRTPPATAATVEEVAALRALVAKYEARLEIDHCYEFIPKAERTGGNVDDALVRKEVPANERASFPDKIECQLVTIALLEEDRDALKAELAAILSARPPVAVPPDVAEAKAEVERLRYELSKDGEDMAELERRVAAARLAGFAEARERADNEAWDHSCDGPMCNCRLEIAAAIRSLQPDPTPPDGDAK